MCQDVPRRLLQIEGSRAAVDSDGVPTWVTLAGIVDLAVGEYVVVYAGQALEKMETADAEELLAWCADLESMLEEAEAVP